MIRKVVRCDLLIADPPFGITDEPWEPKDVEGFNREWSRRWSACGADFVAIFWCQAKLWEGRKWFDESLKGYEFQQMLIWHANNQCGPKSRMTLLKQSWYPIFLYRRQGSSRKVITDGKTWYTECHQLDCHVAAVPQTGYRGEDLKQHPCQKSSSAMRWLINAFSDPGEWFALCSAVWLHAGSQRSSLDAGIGGSSSLLSTGRSPKAGSPPTRTSHSKRIRTRRRSSGLRLRSGSGGSQRGSRRSRSDGSSHALCESRSVAVPSCTAIAST